MNEVQDQIREAFKEGWFAGCASFLDLTLLPEDPDARDALLLKRMLPVERADWNASVALRRSREL